MDTEESPIQKQSFQRSCLEQQLKLHYTDATNAMLIIPSALVPSSILAFLYPRSPSHSIEADPA
jgi:hypothetical protein